MVVPNSSGSGHGAALVEPPFLPILFCGPGANLYPLCDPQAAGSKKASGVSGSGASAVGAASGIDADLPLPASGVKALLPVANVPIIAYPLQLLYSAGFSYAIVFAAKEAHPAISAALRTCSLVHPPHSAPSTSSSTSSINVREWSSSSTSTAGSSNVTAGDPSIFRIELFPLGPRDGKLDSDAEDISFGKRSGAGTAQLLLWLHSLGRLTVSVPATSPR